jgi:hypothetical protein
MTSNPFAPQSALAAAVLLALAVQACGSDNDDGDKPPSNPKQVVSGPPEQQVKQTIDQAQQAAIDGDGKAYCSSLTTVGQANVAAYGRQLGRGASCAQTITANAKLSRKAGLKQHPTRVLSVKVNSDTAVAKVTDGGRAATKMRLIRTPDGWKYQAPKLTAPLSKPTDKVPRFDPSKGPAKQVRRLIHLQNEIERRPHNQTPDAP